ncbi:hypothetical protein V1L54_20330 [Streptomyces sp. TRM 70361]|uniref:hypothetical protein n=1 Tax=Streptomyces sp. TRM 70361 TaxID=3116553 RepID=UPI002E7B418E|nr:hypothetical protein [Streptomyces sp. TRM 70361]MEE1941721.1 hypothetical protein [Streptomyces sp. TRM 70361]
MLLEKVNRDPLVNGHDAGGAPEHPVVPVMTAATVTTAQSGIINVPLANGVVAQISQLSAIMK